MAGGHARSLAYAKHLVTKKTTALKNFDELLKELADLARLCRVPYLEDGQPLVSSALCSAAVPQDKVILHPQHSNTLNLDDARAAGFCIFLREFPRDTFVPVLAPIQLILYLKNMDEDLANDFENAIVSRNEQLLFGGIKFETFHSAFECFYRMIWVNGDLKLQKKARIQDLYGKAGVFPKGFKDEEVPLFRKYGVRTAEESFLSFFLQGNIGNDYVVQDGSVRGKVKTSCPGLWKRSQPSCAHREQLSFSEVTDATPIPTFESSL